MPRKGFKSITVTEKVYDQFYEAYLANKEELLAQGISSFAGYITHLIEDAIKTDEIFTKYTPRMMKISIDLRRIILKDSKLDRIVEITRDGSLFCTICESGNCIHIGYCYSLHQIYPIRSKT